MSFPYKVGFIGVGNLAQALIKGWLERKTLSPQQIIGANRSEGKLQRVAEMYGIRIAATNEELVEQADIVILGMKPQDLIAAVEPISSAFLDKQIVISLAAGITLDTLEKRLPNTRNVRVMCNTPSLINQGVMGYCFQHEDSGLETVVEDLFSPLGTVIPLENEDQLEALTVSSASGTGFIFELMTYWQDWIEERGIDPVIARKITVNTFLGTALLASQSKETTLEDLLGKVTSKKGITAAGLQSMRELEIERALRISFEKSALRNQELAKET